MIHGSTGDLSLRGAVPDVPPQSGGARWRLFLVVAAALVLAVGLWMRNSAPELPITADSQMDAEQIEVTFQDMEMLRQLTLNEPATQQKM